MCFVWACHKETGIWSFILKVSITLDKRGIQINVFLFLHENFLWVLIRSDTLFSVGYPKHTCFDFGVTIQMTTFWYEKKAPYLEFLVHLNRGLRMLL